MAPRYRKPEKQIPEKYFWQDQHQHSKDFNNKCHDCLNYIEDDAGYGCRILDTCKIRWHYTCTPTSSKDISHLYHPNHSLKLLCNGPPHYSNGKCHLCQQKLGKFVYHCSSCDFNLDLMCAKKTLQFMVENSKCHKHTLALMVGPITFTCHACGTLGEGSPYVCQPCFLMYHQDCINLPNVININLHEHRVYRTNNLPLGDRICEICRKGIDWRYGSYSCKNCHNFVVHSKCATRNDVWDGEELEGVPEEVVDIAPFKVIKDGVIKHFSHKKHNLKLIEDVIITNGGEGIRCEACTRCIYSGKHYSCMVCKFVLHQKCANLPLHKRHGLFTQPLSLHIQKPNAGYFRCKACRRVTNGFVYMCPDGSGLLDVRCATLLEFSDTHCHPHPLFLTTLEKGTCGACKEPNNSVLHCVKCNYTLDFRCATQPGRIKHECDDHFLYLRLGKDVSGKCWCEICESLLDPKTWFYSCEDCGVFCHIDCVLGEFANIKPGIVAKNIDVEDKLELVPNNSVSRPRCSKCGERSGRSFIYKFYKYHEKPVYFCCSLSSKELIYFR